MSTRQNPSETEHNKYIYYIRRPDNTTYTEIRLFFGKSIHVSNQREQMIPSGGERRHQEELVRKSRRLFPVVADVHEKRRHEQHVNGVDPRIGGVSAEP